MRLAIRGEGELRDLDIVSLGAGLLLGEPEAGNLGLAEGRPRHHPVVAQLQCFCTGDCFGGDNSLRLGDVSQLQLGGDVTDRVDVRHVGAHPLVNGDRAAVGQRDTRRVQAKALDVRRKSDGLQHLVGDELALLPVLADLDRDLRAIVGDRLDLGARQDLHAQLLVLLLDLLGHLGVLVGQRARQEFDDGDVHAVVLEDVCELHTDGPGARDDDRSGQLAGHDLLLVGDHVLRERGPGHEPHTATGGDDHIGEGQRLGGTVSLLDRQGVGVGEGTHAFIFGDLVLLHQEVHTGHTPLGDLTAAVERGTEIERGLTADAECLGFLGENVGQLRITQQRLGRDTPDIEADSAPILLLNDGCGQAQLGCANSRDIATGTGSENDDVIVCSHELHPSRTMSGGERQARSRY